MLRSIGVVASPTRRRVYVRGARGGLGWCVADRLRELDSIDVVVASGDAPADRASGPCDTIVDVGMADHDLLGRTLPRRPHRLHYFLCGPTPMVTSVSQDLIALGVPFRRIHTERFGSV